MHTNNKRNIRDDGNDSDGSNPNSISAITLQAKRMKLSKTPGELCLANDIHGLIDVPGVIVELGQIAREATLKFDTIEATHTHTNNIMIVSNTLTYSCPDTFLMEVCKKYPHKPPILYCLDQSFHYNNNLIDGNGVVKHVVFTEERWTSILGVIDVIEALQEVRQAISTGNNNANFNPDHGHFVNSNHDNTNATATVGPGEMMDMDLDVSQSSI